MTEIKLVMYMIVVDWLIDTGISCEPRSAFIKYETAATLYLYDYYRAAECRRGLAMRILSVCLSVRLSVKRVNCDKTEEKSVHIFIPYERSFSLVF